MPDAEPGDDTVSVFHGDPGDKTAMDEANLDIQFIMGVTPGIKTDFYLYRRLRTHSHNMYSSPRA